MDIDRQKIMAELQRQDSNAPLNRFNFNIQGLDMEKLREYLELPDQFLRSCTLREGTIVIVLTLNSVALALIGYIAWLHLDHPEDTDEWWQERFRDDFDFYYMDEYQSLRDSLWPLWRPISMAVILVKAIYFISGCLVFHALIRKVVHPFWYLPWLVVTGFLVSVMWLIAFSMIIVLFILLTFRPITVTWDIGPIACVIAYGVMWTYGWFVVIAHYKRRWIVHYWRIQQKLLGTETLGPVGLSVPT